MATIVRTPQEIEAEIKALEEIKPRVRHYGAAGDNHVAIDAQIATLKKALNDPTKEPDIEEFDDDPDPDHNDPSYNYDCARDAVNWLTGDHDEPESSEWAVLAQ